LLALRCALHTSYQGRNSALITTPAQREGNAHERQSYLWLW